MREMVLTASTEKVPPLCAVVEAYIGWGLTRCGGNVAEAADLLQVSRDMVREWEPRTQGDTVRIVDSQDSPSPAPSADVPAAQAPGFTLAPTSLGYVLL